MAKSTPNDVNMYVDWEHFWVLSDFYHIYNIWRIKQYMTKKATRLNIYDNPKRVSPDFQGLKRKYAVIRHFWFGRERQFKKLKSKTN